MIRNDCMPNYKYNAIKIAQEKIDDVTDGKSKYFNSTIFLKHNVSLHSLLSVTRM